MDKIKFTILGSSAGMPQADRVNSGYVLDVDDGLNQFDCGGGVSSAFRRQGFDPIDVKSIVISHTHPDHISDLPLFVQMQYLAGRRDSIDIYLPSEIIRPIRDYFHALYLFPEKLPFEINFLPVNKGDTINLDGISIHPILNTHLIGHADLIKDFGFKNQMQCFSYLIHASDKSIVYSADLGSEKDLGAYLTDVDLLVVESTHIEIASMIDMALDYNVGKVVLTHLAEDFDTNGAIAQAQKAGYKNLIIAQDGMRIKL
ncbi:MAG: MBL fold metallo-hydrolase [candidate division Zixibacteria bacterium]